MSTPDQKLVRVLFQRLVTPDGTRAIVELSDLEGVADSERLHSVIDTLVAARLLTTRGDHERAAAVEIVHESLISGWPTLRRWLDEEGEDSAFLQQLSSAAKQWDQRGRPQGLLWRGEAMEEAQRFQRRYRGDLARLEREYLDEVLALANRAARRRRQLVTAAFATLIALVAAAVVVILWIRQAETTAQSERAEAQKQKTTAENEAERARAAEAKIKAQLEEIQRARSQAKSASEAAAAAEKKVESGKHDLALTYEQLQKALEQSEHERTVADSQRRKAEAATRAAEAATTRAEAATKEAKRLLAKEKARVEELKKRASKLIKGSDLR